MEGFGSSSVIGRPGQPSEVAPTYVWLASAEGALYREFQRLHLAHPVQSLNPRYEIMDVLTAYCLLKQMDKSCIHTHLETKAAHDICLVF